MNERDIQFLESAFKKYYYDHISEIPVPDDILHREFGYQKLGVGGMTRHIQVKDAGQMRVMFMKTVPSDAYCSNSYYSFPNLDMREKDWRGADLVFDIDAKDLDLPCRRDHVLAVCEKCGRSWMEREREEEGKGKQGKEGERGAGEERTVGPGRECGSCGQAGRVRPKSLPCKECIAASKKQVALLNRILRDELGVGPDHMSTYFSGNEGFHVHVSDPRFRGLDARARADLAGYVMLSGLIPEALGVHKTSGLDRAELPDLGQKGWRGRFAKAAFGSKAKRAETISEVSKAQAGAAYARFEGIIREVSGDVGAKIDAQVTGDIHRIFRMPYTINSKSGMLKMACAGDADAFDPYVDAVVLDADETVSVECGCPVRFGLGRKGFGPYKEGESVELPVYAAAYAICKGFGRLAADASGTTSTTSTAAANAD
ncbi:MAG: DNA primase [Thaumarchaeota archaeon]|nr:DNA primase [Nitrososphaerota archaeon]